MRRAAVVLLAITALASCPRIQPDRVTVAAPGLETAAVLRGIVRDPDTTDPTGLYARDTDRLCVVRDGGAYRIGAYVDYGDGLGCNGVGSLRRSGDALQIRLSDGCAFGAGFDGDRIAFPAELPKGCADLCTRRATFAALHVDRLSESASEAAAMRDARGALPCG